MAGEETSPKGAATDTVAATATATATFSVASVGVSRPSAKTSTALIRAANGGSKLMSKSAAEHYADNSVEDAAQQQQLEYANGHGTGNGNGNALLFCCGLRLKDMPRNYSSLPLFVYMTSQMTQASSADGVGVGREIVLPAQTNENNGLEHANDYNAEVQGSSSSSSSSKQQQEESAIALCNRRRSSMLGVMECLPPHTPHSPHSAHIMTASTTTSRTTPMSIGGSTYGLATPQHLNLHPNYLQQQQHQHHHAHMHMHQQQHQHQHQHSPYSNNYPLHHSAGHGLGHVHGHNLQHNLHSDQAKSLQELQLEVGALLEFRDLVIETIPSIKQRMASMTTTTTTSVLVASPTAATSSTLGAGAVAAAASTSSACNSVGSQSASGATTLIGVASPSLLSRREWEPGIHAKRKTIQKDITTIITASTAASTTTATVAAAAGVNGNAGGVAGAALAELSSPLLMRSRSNSHSGKKEPKSGENNNGSVIQDSGFSTETSSSKEGHSASSTNGAMTVAIASSNRSNGNDSSSDDELFSLLNLIQRMSSRVVVQRNHHHCRSPELANALANEANEESPGAAVTMSADFRQQLADLSKEDAHNLRVERDRLLDQLAERGAEMLTDRVKLTQMNAEVERLASTQRDLEEQLQQALAQKIELNTRLQQLQSKSSNTSSVDQTSQLSFLSSPNTVLSAVAAGTSAQQRRQQTFQPLVAAVRQEAVADTDADAEPTTDAANRRALARLDGIVSTPGASNMKCRSVDTKRIAAILMETNVLVLRRHLLTISAQNQVLQQRLNSSNKMNDNLQKRLDDVDHLRFQLDEKIIELEGTKAQMRILESRMHSPLMHTSSFLHSQTDYETNRSSASTTLTLSRRGISNFEHDSSLDETTTTTVKNSSQVSTSSMKAMEPLFIDDAQPAKQQQQQQQQHSGTTTNANKKTEDLTCARKYGAVNKPSKIPLPGSKAAAYFAGKPPTGRPATAGRSPNSANTSSTSYGSTKSTLSRSTGNLLHGKSPNSLRRADSAQSIASTNASRSCSNSSSIQLATPYSSSASNTTYNVRQTTMTPSSVRVLQNSPLPKPKRESLTSRVRYLDSLSRAQQQHGGSGNDNAAANSPKSSYQQQHVTRQQPAAARRSETTTTTTTFRRNNYPVTSTPERPTTGVARRFSSAATAAARPHYASGELAGGGVGAGGSAPNAAHSPNDGDSSKVRNFKSTLLGWLKI